LHGAEPTALVTNLQTLAPNAKITTDTKAGRLVVLATPSEHEIIQGAMAKLGRGTTLDNTPQVETYRLTRVDPSTLLPLLQSLLPEAKVSDDAQTKTQIAFAVPADQQTIRALVEQLQPQKSGRDAPELRTYPLASADATSVLTMLKGLYHWSWVCGIGVPADEVFENHSIAWQSATVFFAVIDLVAAVGLWLAAAWGAVIWLTAVASMLTVEIFFPQIFGGGLLTGFTEGLLLALYLWLALKSAQEQPA
jgi:hypothetical protein